MAGWLWQAGMAGAPLPSGSLTWICCLILTCCVSGLPCSIHCTALTAFQALKLARLQPGQRVLIHAAAGGVGSAAVQIARAQGLQVGQDGSISMTCVARSAAVCANSPILLLSRWLISHISLASLSPAPQVVATASAANTEFVRSLGADQVIDYKQQRCVVCMPSGGCRPAPHEPACVRG